MHDIIKFAVVGCGHIGRRHAEIIQRNKEAELVALVDIKPKEALNIDHFKVPFYSSLDDLLTSGVEADVINIATPNGLHAPHAILCLESDKHVVIEKPLALSTPDALRINGIAIKKDKHVFSVMQNRYSPPSTWIKQVVDSGILGKIFMVQLNCYWNRDERYYKPGGWHGTSDLDGGTLFTQFSHFIDILFWLFGDLKNIESRMATFNHRHLSSFEDSGIIYFELEKGGIGSINFSTSVWDKNLESSITIIAENGTVKIGGQYMDKVEYCHIKNYFMPDLAPTNPGNDYGDYKGSAANHHFIIENVINVLKGRDNISTNCQEGLKVVNIIERIYAASRNDHS